MFDSLEIALEEGKNHITILNSSYETVQDTVIVK